MVSEDYTVNFLLRLLSKDLAYAQSAAAQAGVDLTTATNAKQLFDRAAAAGYGEKDMSAVVEVLRHPSHPKCIEPPGVRYALPTPRRRLACWFYGCVAR